MNYQRIYDDIIKNAKLRGLDKKKIGYYTEIHHIIPRCLNGNNISNNLVLLTGREHYICHWLLWRSDKNNNSLLLAYHKMIYQKRIYQDRNFRITSKQYEILKAANSIRMKLNNPSGEGDRNSFYGKKHSVESKEKIRLAWVERRKIGVTNETRKKMSDSHRLNPQCGLKNPMFGKKLSKDHNNAFHSKSKGGLNQNSVKCNINNIKFDTLKYGYEYVKNKLEFEGSAKVFRRYLKQKINGWYIIEEVNNGK